MFQPNMFESHHHLLDMSHKSPENDLDLIRDNDEFESKSMADIMENNPSGDDQEVDPNQRPNKKKRYHRHTQLQITEMES